jgi:hypothetical protein
LVEFQLANSAVSTEYICVLRFQLVESQMVGLLSSINRTARFQLAEQLISVKTIGWSTEVRFSRPPCRL